MNYLFALLIVVTQKVDVFDYPMENRWRYNYTQTHEDSLMVDQWDASYVVNMCPVAASSHYKAVLFQTREGLQKYINTNGCDGALVIDIVNGGIHKVKQVKVMRTEKREESVFDHFESEITP